MLIWNLGVKQRWKANEWIKESEAFALQWDKFSDKNEWMIEL